MINRILVVLLLFAAHAPLLAQTQYNLAFNPSINGNKLSVEIQLGFNVSGKLGTSNFTFNFNSNGLQNPVLSMDHLPGPPFYQNTTVSNPITGVVSINVELPFANFGTTFGTTLAPLAVVEFDITDNTQVAGLSWRTNSLFSNTVVFLDDNATALTPGTISNAANFSLAGSPLPVELTDFSARALTDQTTWLRWFTQSESSNDHFVIEHSQNFKDFKTIGKIKGKGTTTEMQSYQFVHMNPVPGENYYRLKQVDWDGQYEYSDIEVVYFKPDQAKQLLQVYPNPTSDFLNVSSSFLSDQKLHLEIYDMKGRLVFNKPFESFKSKERLSLNFLASGRYLCQFITPSSIYAATLVVQKP